MVENQRPLDHVFAALSDPIRRALLARLRDGPLTVGELAEPFTISLAGVSKHLGVLSRAGLVDQQKVGRQTRCELRGEALRLAADWVRDYEVFWSERLEALDRVVRSERTRKQRTNSRVRTN